jgi:phosphoglycolate phosphatase
MAKRFDLIVFDWDGTLMDSAGVIVACIQAACVDLGIEPPPDAVARHVIGLGLHDALSSAVPSLPVGEYRRVAQRYRHHYLSRDHELTLFPGARELITELHELGFLLAVATGKSRLGLDRALGATGLGRFFHATRCADECSSKPDPAMLLELMEELAVVAPRTLMVGDTTHDLVMARNAGVSALAAGFGAHAHDALMAEGPLHVAQDFRELASWLRTHA